MISSKLVVFSAVTKRQGTSNMGKGVLNSHVLRLFSATSILKNLVLAHKSRFQSSNLN